MKKVLLDCDPGIDDALALMYLAGLHRAGEISLSGVTTTAGNVGVKQTALNAAWILEQCGLGEVPVQAGESAPLVVDLVTTPETHGPEGLGYFSAPAPASTDLAAAQEQETWQEMWKAAAAAGAHLIVTGPVTNLARYVDSAGAAGFSSITIMGGAINYRGNTTPTAEWNFWVDPDAARSFFEAPAHSTLCSLEVTEQFLVDPQRFENMLEILNRHPLTAVLPEILRFYFEFHEKQGEGYQAQIHDLLTCMIALGTVPYEAMETTVAVEAQSQLLRGTSVADLRGHWNRPANCAVVTGADIEAAHREFSRALKLLASPENAVS
ncbi:MULTISPECIES: nucleoside hydrolase [Corynebacterium]|uniref:nucleoside hydrolase n=1 Tax=Corynebacterium TaxID=1716 RepID=UPI00257CB130|nr:MULTISPECIES: nucleoside hydrolase [Corynebacterium]